MYLLIYFSMKYTEATICETLRLSSVAPMGIAHMALESATLGDYVIPKVNIHIMKCEYRTWKQ